MLRGVHFQPTDSAVLHCFDVDFAEAGSEIEEECQWPSMTFFTASTATCLYRHLAAISSKWIKICSRSIPSGGTSYRFQQNFSRLKLVKRIATEKRHNFIRDMVQRGAVRLDHIGTDEQVADILTKPLGKVKFLTFRESLGVVERPYDVGPVGR